jgi:hypothetical protein
MTSNNKKGKLISYLWLGFVGFIALIDTIGSFKANKILFKEDFYGQYVID